MQKNTSTKAIKQELQSISNYNAIANITGLSAATVRATFDNRNSRYNPNVIKVAETLITLHKNLKVLVSESGEEFSTEQHPTIPTTIISEKSC